MGDIHNLMGDIHKTAVGMILGVALSVAPGMAQRTTQPTNPGTGGGRTPTPTTPTTPTPGRQPTQPDSPFPEIEQPVFLSGRVMMEDGTPPPESVTIVRVCNGNPRPESYTDGKGHFSFQLGQNSGLIADASYSGYDMTPIGRSGGRSTGAGGGQGGRLPNLMGCELRASLPGYTSQAIDLSQRRALDRSDIGVIILHRMGNVQGSTISLTSLQAPKEAQKAYEKGSGAIKKQKWAEAQKHLEKAVGAYPKYAAAWFELGRAYQEQGNAAEAGKAYQQALDADPKYLKPYVHMAGIAMKEKNWNEAARITGRLIDLDPVDYPVGYLYNSIAQLGLQNLEGAEKSARAGMKLDSGRQLPKFSHVMALISASRGDYSGAAQFLRDYLDAAPAAVDANAVRRQLVEFEKRSGQPAAQAQPRN